MGDRYNIHSQLEHLQSKYIGTGHADTNKWEWLTNQHRDRLYLEINCKILSSAVSVEPFCVGFINAGKLDMQWKNYLAFDEVVIYNA